jgi:hypothetical protein
MRKLTITLQHNGQHISVPIVPNLVNYATLPNKTEFNLYICVETQHFSVLIPYPSVFVERYLNVGFNGSDNYLRSPINDLPSNYRGRSAYIVNDNNVILDKHGGGVLLTKLEKIGWFVTIVAGILSIAQIIAPNIWILSLMPPLVTGFLLASFIISFVFLARRGLSGKKISNEDISEKGIYKGIRFYISREELPSLGAFLSQAKQEVFVAGTTLQAIVGSNRETIRDLVKRGVTVRLLFLDPKSKFLDKLSDCLVGESKYNKAIIVSLETACTVKRELAEVEKNRLDIRTYDTLPFYTMLMIDPNTGDGTVRIEPYFYGKGERARSSFQISEKAQKDEFQKHLAGYKYLCKVSNEYQCH